MALSLVLVTAATAQKRHPSLVVEDSYREALAKLAAGSPGQAVSRVVVLERESSAGCLQSIELRTGELLVRRNAESLVVQAFLRLAVRQARYRAHTASGDLYGFERTSMGTLEGLADLYVAASQQEDAPSIAAGLLASMAEAVAEVRSTKRVEAARSLLEAALSHDQNHRAALYSLAVTLELQGRPAQALPHLDRLLALEPENPAARVRRALVTVKAGRVDRGEELLEELTTSGPTWTRDLATQEFARLLAAGGRKDEAVALLRQGLRELPREKLSLQLAALLDPRWTDSWEVLGVWLDGPRPAGPAGDSEPSARWIYEGGAKEDLDALRVELGSEVSGRLAGLERTLSQLPGPADYQRKKLAGCR